MTTKHIAIQVFAIAILFGVFSFTSTTPPKIESVTVTKPLRVSEDPSIGDFVLEPLASQYERAIAAHYIPAKHAAEAGTGTYHRAYEVARLISGSCTLRASWDPIQLERIVSEPEELPGMQIDWQKKSVIAARELTNCIQIVRSETR